MNRVRQLGEERKRPVHRWVCNSALWQAHPRANHAGVKSRTSLEMRFFKPSPFPVLTEATSGRTRTYTGPTKELRGQGENMVFCAKHVFFMQRFQQENSRALPQLPSLVSVVTHIGTQPHPVPPQPKQVLSLRSTHSTVRTHGADKLPTSSIRNKGFYQKTTALFGSCI